MHQRNCLNVDLKKIFDKYVENNKLFKNVYLLYKTETASDVDFKTSIFPMLISKSQYFQC